MFLFTPVSADIAKLVELLNLYAFNDPAPAPLRFKIYINPMSGRNQGEKIYHKRVEPFLQAAGCSIHRTAQDGNTNYTHVVTTTSPGFARTDAMQIPVANFDTVMCIGGDGLIHEVINGLANHKDGARALRRLAIAVIPAGSGNAMSNSLFGHVNPSYATWQALNNCRMKVDLMSLTPVAKDAPPLWLFLSVAMGWIAKADVGTDSLRRAGDFRFLIGASLQVIMRNTSDCSIATHGDLAQPTDPNADAVTQRKSVKTQLKDFYNEQYNRRQLDYPVSELPKQGAVEAIVDSHLPMDKWVHVAPKSMNSFYAGKIPWVSKGTCIFPAALPNDGYIDLCILTEAGLNSGTKALTKAASGEHWDQDKISYYKVKAFKLIPGVKFQGDDIDNLNKAATERTIAEGGGHIRRRDDVDVKAFRNEYYLSVDGERYDPGHGVVCEAHQGLATFICDKKLEKYLPTILHNGGISQTDKTRREALKQANQGGEGDMTSAQWLETWEGKLRAWKLQRTASVTLNDVQADKSS